MGKGSQEYQVQSIIGKRRKKNSGTVEYRVLWKGYSKDEATWEPQQHLQNIQYMIDQFNQKIQLRKNNNIQNITLPNLSAQKTTEQMSNSQQQKKKQNNHKQTKRPLDQQNQKEDNLSQDQNLYQYKKTPQINLNQKEKNSVNKIQEEEKSIQKKNVQITSYGTTKSTSNSNMQRKTIMTDSKRQMVQREQIQNEIEIDEQQKGSQTDDQLKPILEITGMYMNEKGEYEFTVIQKELNRRLRLKRNQVIKRDPVALIRFYEQNLNAKY